MQFQRRFSDQLKWIFIRLCIIQIYTNDDLGLIEKLCRIIFIFAYVLALAI